MQRLVLCVTIALAALAGAARCDTVYFIVGEAPGHSAHGDSYVLPLTEPADIAHAYELIDDGPFGRPHIVVADLAWGADGVNRDYLGKDQRPWSWHVVEFLGFADMTIEILDGTPTQVEAEFDRFPSPGNPGRARIGFWNYTIVGVVPEPASVSLLGFGGAAVLRRRQRGGDGVAPAHQSQG